MLNVLRSLTDKKKQFNDKLFMRDHMQIVEEIKRLIKSIERESVYKIRVKGFSVIDDYAEIKFIQQNSYDSVKKAKKKAIKENPFACVDMNDSDVIVLIVSYEIEDSYGVSEELNVPIYIPIFVNKYYMHIKGVDYVPLLQIVDGSTYNKPKGGKYLNNTVIGKTLFGAIKMYNNPGFYSVQTADGMSLNCTIYTANIYNRTTNAMLFILAKFGLYGAMSYLGFKYMYLSSDEIRLSNPDDFYRFIFGANINLYVPKIIYDNDKVTQSFVGSLVYLTGKNDSLYQIGTDTYWVLKLAESVKFYNLGKGYSTLQQLEMLYDDVTKEYIMLPEDSKKDIYDFLVWMMREYDSLLAKNNYSLKGKRIRLGEYIAHVYASKLGHNFMRLNNKEKSTDIKTLRAILNIEPEYLMGYLYKTGIFEVMELPNDDDAKLATKFSFKGPSGLGQPQSGLPVGNKRGKDESSSKAQKGYLPVKFRHVDLSHLGVIDLSTSPKSDPGLGGLLVPFAEIHEKGYLYEFQEPNNWTEDYNKLVNDTNLENMYRDFLPFRDNKVSRVTKTMKNEDGEVVAVPNNMRSLPEYRTTQIDLFGHKYNLE